MACPLSTPGDSDSSVTENHYSVISAVQNSSKPGENGENMKLSLFLINGQLTTGK